MSDNAHRDEDEQVYRDQDKPADVSNASDHRPDHAGAPGWQHDDHAGDDTHQNPEVKQPPAAQLHKQQRSQGMNRSGLDGRS